MTDKPEVTPAVSCPRCGGSRVLVDGVLHHASHGMIQCLEGRL